MFLLWIGPMVTFPCVARPADRTEIREDVEPFLVEGLDVINGFIGSTAYPAQSSPVFNFLLKLLWCIWND
jgi:hypothetical protein